jgi:hypothetical protein
MIHQYLNQNMTSYPQRIEEENKLSHWLRVRWKKAQYTQSQLSILPLEYGVFTGVINLDRFNLFLLGLHYHGTKVLHQLLAELFLVHNLICSIALILTHGLLHYKPQ